MPHPSPVTPVSPGRAGPVSPCGQWTLGLSYIGDTGGDGAGAAETPRVTSCVTPVLPGHAGPVASCVIPGG